MLEEEDPQDPQTRRGEERKKSQLQWKLVLPRINQVKYTESVFHVNNVNNKDLLQPCSEGGRPREDIGRRRDFNKVKRREQNSLQEIELSRPGLGRLALKRGEQKSVHETELCRPGLGQLALKRREQKSVGGARASRY